MRINKKDYYLKIAETIAIHSTCLKHKYDAIIVNNDIVVATDCNGSPRGEVNCCDMGVCYCDTHSKLVHENTAAHGSQYGLCVAVHAEQNAIIPASHKELSGATLYFACLSDKPNTGPCSVCDRIIKNAGIAEIIMNGGSSCKQPH